MNKTYFSQKGGNGSDGVYVPNNRGVQNDPTKPIQRSSLEQQRFQEKKFTSAPSATPPVLELKMFQTPEKKAPKQEFQLSPYPFPIFNPEPGLTVSQFPGMFNQNLFGPTPVTVVKNYQLSVPGPTGGHGTTGTIMEDILPIKDLNNSFLSLNERLKILEYVRAFLIKQADGENITLRDGSNSLMRYIKYLNLNPYHHSTYSNNPYKSLAVGFMLYNSCYPIQYDDRTAGTKCAKNSMSINIRFLELKNVDYDVKSKDSVEYFKYNTWREIGFYEYIRENIIKKKKCPNFAMMFSYYVCQNCGIDFDKLAQLKGITKKREIKKLTPTLSYDSTTIANAPFMLESQSNKKSLFPQDSQGNTILPDGRKVIKMYPTQHDMLKVMNMNRTSFPQFQYQNTILTIDKTRSKKPEDYSGHAIIQLTEAPTQNLIMWASKVYKQDLNINQMVNTGVYSELDWMCVYFQIISGLCVLQTEEILLQNMTVRDNIYIKDLHNSLNPSGSNGYWKYIIDGITYYIPNRGYIVLIDSNYKDLPIEESILKKKSNTNTFKTKKIISNKIYDDKENSGEIKKRIFENFKRIVNKDVFGNEFKNSGGVQPPTKILDLLTEIDSGSTDPTTKFSDYLFKFFNRFLNNRIGTPLREKELELLSKSANQAETIKRGEIVAYKTGADENMWVMHLRSYTISDPVFGQRYVCEILNKNDSGDYERSEVTRDSLFLYTKHTPLVQNEEIGGMKFTEENLLDTYVM